MTHASDLYLKESLRRELGSVKAERDQLQVYLDAALDREGAGDRLVMHLQAERDRYRAALEEAAGALEWSTGAWGNPRKEDIALALPHMREYIARARAALQGEAQHDD